ncbi:hypothetical protein JQC67_04460 [Aurantibacter crassamenti]|uniref:hypothetical protein n=1 Tax=Aurantibacter crassamenti TaxID=1837375 RepID=UPI00193AD1FB|nr:hypothetical protein [Aurantibacter crassamenti]MBM1105388.1 hypothetical protein [Aurantibacter crassamenti]
MKGIKRQTLLVGCTLALMLTFGCSKDNPLNPLGNCYDGNWAAQYTNELQVWSAAATAYNENPNVSTCADYKNAAKAYLDALENIYDCVPTANRSEFDQEINEAKAEIDSEDCNS